MLAPQGRRPLHTARGCARRAIRHNRRATAVAQPLAAAMSQIDRKYGKGSIMKMGEASSRLVIDVIPTGAIALDIALGVGGVPRGRVIEIYGPESSGKTTLAQHIVAQAQKLGGVAA